MSKLFSTTHIPAISGRKEPPSLRRFAQEEDGALTFAALAMLGGMILIGGIYFDMQRNEMERVRIQNTADRAVLAAADLDQTLDPTEVVQDYFDKAGIPDRANSVTVDEGLNFRTVSVNSDSVTPTNFMNMLGIDELPLRSYAEAEERVNNVEISMVLDISGSMSEGDKMSQLRDAANVFVDTVINPSTEDLVSLSIIPYSEHVSAGPEIMSHFNVNWNNSYSHCMEFSESDFDTSTMRRNKTYKQVQHFDWGYNGYSNTLDTPVCPSGSYEDIVAFSQDVAALKYKISQLVPRGSTSIFAGMKWAAGLLDPDFNTITQSLIASGDADEAFSARPASFNDHETLKTVILMTDGKNHYSYRINDNYYANASHAAHWNRYNLDWYLSRYVQSYYHNQFKYLKYWPDYGDTLLGNVCDAAKEKNIVIWSIGFEVSDHSAGVMENCASSPSHFFRVEGVEIKDAFKAIARQINQLRLTQ
ncbi:pilus assembly protein TadG-related protein [Sulfitobacter sp. HNIBRBA2951]|uniref:pilus assembly protein TadG-related protein n=1 Tax=Sulfitobacter aquimarinus TaxID=3158557 RepID=UPI0032DE76D5